jgi:hypothetical protein
MTSRSGIKKVVAGALVATAVTLSSLAGGLASADGGTEDINIGVGELQECTISKSMDAASGSGSVVYTGLEGASSSTSGYNTWRTNFGRTY